MAITTSGRLQGVVVTGSRGSVRLLNGSLVALLGRRTFLPGMSFSAAFAEGDASSHTRIYFTERLVCSGLSRAIGRHLWEMMREGVREGLFAWQRPGADCSGGTRCEYGVPGRVLVNPLNRGTYPARR